MLTSAENRHLLEEKEKKKKKAPKGRKLTVKTGKAQEHSKTQEAHRDQRPKRESKALKKFGDSELETPASG